MSISQKSDLLQLRVEPELKTRVLLAASERDISATELIRQAIEAELAQLESGKPRSNPNSLDLDPISAIVKLNAEALLNQIRTTDALLARTNEASFIGEFHREGDPFRRA